MGKHSVHELQNQIAEQLDTQKEMVTGQHGTLHQLVSDQQSSIQRLSKLLEQTKAEVQTLSSVHISKSLREVPRTPKCLDLDYSRMDDDVDFGPDVDNVIETPSSSTDSHRRQMREK